MKTDGCGEMVVAFTITEIKYLVVRLFFDVMYLVLLAALFALFPA